MSSVPEFVEILRVSSAKDSKVNNIVKPEVILVEDIKNFRAWHKGKNDLEIKGDMTIIILKPESKINDATIDESIEDGKAKVKTILIKESFKDFLNRMSVHIPIRKLDDYYLVGKENGSMKNGAVIRHPEIK